MRGNWRRGGFCVRTDLFPIRVGLDMFPCNSPSPSKPKGPWGQRAASSLSHVGWWLPRGRQAASILGPLPLGATSADESEGCLKAPEPFLGMTPREPLQELPGSSWLGGHRAGAPHGLLGCCCSSPAPVLRFRPSLVFLGGGRRGRRLRRRADEKPQFWGSGEAGGFLAWAFHRGPPVAKLRQGMEVGQPRSSGPWIEAALLSRAAPLEPRSGSACRRWTSIPIMLCQNAASVLVHCHSSICTFLALGASPA